MSDHQPKETAKAYAAFQEYCALGLGRSLAKLAQKYSKNTSYVRQLARWSSAYDWVARAAAYDKERAEQERAEREEAIRQMNQRHAMIGTSQQARAIKQVEALIEAKKFGSQAAVQLLKLATDLERIARGAPTERSEITGQDGEPFTPVRIYIPDNSRDGYDKQDGDT